MATTVTWDVIEDEGIGCLSMNWDEFLEDLVDRLGMESGEFSILLTGDERMRDLNKQYRNLDKTTDVLSFPQPVDPSEPHTHWGDIVISVPMAQKQADEMGHPLEGELRFLALHGLLHLLGHDHETDQGEMEVLQKRIRQDLAHHFS